MFHRLPPHRTREPGETWVAWRTTHVITNLLDGVFLFGHHGWRWRRWEPGHGPALTAAQWQLSRPALLAATQLILNHLSKTTNSRPADPGRLEASCTSRPRQLLCAGPAWRVRVAALQECPTVTTAAVAGNKCWIRGWATNTVTIVCRALLCVHSLQHRLPTVSIPACSRCTPTLVCLVHFSSAPGTQGADMDS